MIDRHKNLPEYPENEEYEAAPKEYQVNYMHNRLLKSGIN